MLRPTLSFLALLLATGANAADNCDAIRAQIESRIKAGGVASFTLTTIDAAASGVGKLVGTCALGTRKILYVAAPSTPGASAAARPRKAGEALLTECKDGSMSVGGDCKP